jgi:hypothetical protein
VVIFKLEFNKGLSKLKLFERSEIRFQLEFSYFTPASACNEFETVVVQIETVPFEPIMMSNLRVIQTGITPTNPRRYGGKE